MKTKVQPKKQELRADLQIILYNYLRVKLYIIIIVYLELNFIFRVKFFVVRLSQVYPS